MKGILVQCALSASRTKNTFLENKYHRLAARRGKKKAAVAIGHKILIIAYYILTEKVPYRELGANYLDKRNKKKVERHHIKRLEDLGYEVILVEKKAA